MRKYLGYKMSCPLPGKCTALKVCYRCKVVREDNYHIVNPTTTLWTNYHLARDLLQKQKILPDPINVYLSSRILASEVSKYPILKPGWCQALKTIKWPLEAKRRPKSKNFIKQKLFRIKFYP